MAQSFRQLLGVPPSTASPSDSTLIIIDAQNEYAEGKLKVSETESRKAIAGLLEKYRADKGKIVHVKHIVPDGAPVFTPKTKLQDEFEELTPKDGEKVIEKNHPSSFADTSLDEYLKGAGSSKKIVLTGFMAHVCVSTTARDAARLGYDVVLAEDAIGDRDIPGATGAEVTKMTMHELGDAFATVVQSKDIK